MKDDQVDEACAKFKSIREEIDKLSKEKWSEADTRLKVINRILFDVLGWNLAEANVEERAGTGYTDYSLKIGTATRAIVEAKKDSIEFDLKNRYSAKAYKLNGTVFNTEAKSAIDQALVYSAYKNCELACATNGNEWVIFRANRLGDGIDTLNGMGFVFNSLLGIEENFRLFFDLLGKTSVQSLKFRGEFQKAEGTPIRDLSFFKSARSPISKKLLSRGEFANDFDALMTSFFERLKGDQDSEMIKQCFVVTNESEFADEKLLRIAEDLVEKVKHLDTSTGQALVDLIESAKLQHRNRFILLVGNKGAGKSTFVDRFFKHVLPEATYKELVLLRIDLSLNSGDEKNIIDWLNKRMLEECEKSVFTSEGPDWNECVEKCSLMIIKDGQMGQ